MLRFITNAKNEKGNRESLPALITLELDNVLKTLVKVVQLESFEDEIKQLKKGHEVSKGSKIISLNPFLDTEGLIFESKGVHLELVSDLTTSAFIGCLKRFVARWGTPNKIYCDNATNFVGARNEL